MYSFGSVSSVKVKEFSMSRYLQVSERGVSIYDNLQPFAHEPHESVGRKIVPGR